jgi:mannopine transport system permease protein
MRNKIARRVRAILQIDRFWNVVLATFVGLTLFFLILPTLLIIPMSFGTSPFIEFPPRGLTLQWYVKYLSDPDWIAATLFSLRTALATTVVATIVGTLASVALVRGNLPGKAIIQGLTLSPMVVPHVVIAISIYLVFAPLSLTGNFFGFVIAHTMLAVPYVVITVSAALQRFDVSLELAALNCGASRPRAFFSIVLPNILPGVTAGSVFAFLASFDEATIAFFISGIEGKPLTRKLFEDIDFNLTPVIAAVSTVLAVSSILLMGAIHLSGRERK